MIWLVFFGKERGHLHVHDAGLAMKIPLAVLAIGSFITWLFIGGFSRLLSTTLPFHRIEQESTQELVWAILFAPVTWIALLIVAFGFALFWWRGRSSALAQSRLQPLVDTAFGFEPINHFIVQTVSNFAERLRATQTGQLNWNILGIISGLLVVLIALWLGS
jgi:NADH-quinone oxidoreductase subunit L